MAAMVTHARWPKSVSISPDRSDSEEVCVLHVF